MANPTAITPVALPNAIAGSNHEGYDVTMSRDDGSGNPDLTGATMSAKIQPTDGSGVLTGASRAATGTFAITNAAGGAFHWSPSAADCVAGTFQVQFIGTYADTTIIKTRPAPWLVETSIA